MKHYLELSGKKYRVEVNWNANTDYLDQIGGEDLSALDNLATMKASEFLLYIHCCIKEGERMDEREFKLTTLDLGGIMRQGDILKFVDIYKQQSGISTSVADVPKKKGMIPRMIKRS